MKPEEIDRVFNKHRSRASTALIALRQAMGKTQQEFAVLILHTAITTVARYETSNPPRGDVLIRLANIAEKNNLFSLRDEFLLIYLDEVLENVKFNLLTTRDTDDGRRGYLALKLEGDGQILAAINFLRTFPWSQKRPKMNERHWEEALERNLMPLEGRSKSPRKARPSGAKETK